MHAPSLRLSAVLASGLLACASSNDRERVAVASEALSACDETVPANRFIDGIPAYAQCAATQNSAIYSNNGVDTSVTSMGSDWIRTQYSGGYQCTELAHRYLYFKWNVNWIPNGNAGNWCDTPPPASSGLVQSTTPVHGDLMVLAPGSCGASTTAGHVNVIDTVDMAAAKVVAVEQNVANRGTYMQSCAKCFLHVVANDGNKSGSAGAPASSGGAGMIATGAAGRSGSSGAPATTPVTSPPPPSSTTSTGGSMAAPMTPMTTAAMQPAAPAASIPPSVMTSTGAAGVPPTGSAGAIATAPSTVPLPHYNGAKSGCSAASFGRPADEGSRSIALLLGVLAMLAARRRNRARRMSIQ